MYQLRVGNTVSKHRLAYKLQNFLEAVPPAPKSINYLPVYSMKRIAFGSNQGLALLGFFPYALSFSQSLTNADIFLSLWQGSDPQKFSDFEQHKYQNLIQKMSMGPYVAKMFFLQSRQMKVSGYIGVWYKNV